MLGAAWEWLSGRHQRLGQLARIAHRQDAARREYGLRRKVDGSQDQIDVAAALPAYRRHGRHQWSAGLGRWSLEPDTPGQQSLSELRQIGSRWRAICFGTDHRRFEALGLLRLQTEQRKVALSFKPGDVVPDQPSVANADLPVLLLAILNGGERNLGEVGFQSHRPVRMPDQHIGHPGCVVRTDLGGDASPSRRGQRTKDPGPVYKAWRSA